MANDPLSHILTPELTKTPSVASGVISKITQDGTLAQGTANPGDIHPEALVASQAINNVGIKDAVQAHAQTVSSPGFWGRLGLDINKGLNFLNKPLQTMQSDYKFFHAAYKDHGFGGALVVSLPTIFGGIVGSLGGPEGTVVGADLGSWVSKEAFGHMGMEDSFKKSMDPNYDVSAGRDWANLLGSTANEVGLHSIGNDLLAPDNPLKEGNQSPFRFLGKAISGSSDMAFDWEADPFSAVSKFSQAMREGSNLIKVGEKGSEAIALQIKSPITKWAPNTSQTIQDLMGEKFAVRSANPLTADQANSIFNARKDITNGVANNYGRATEHISEIVNTSSTKALATSKILANYPKIDPIIADRLASTGVSAEKVHETLVNGAYFDELTNTLGAGLALPSRSLMRENVLGPIQKLLRGDKDIPVNQMNKINKIYSTFSNQLPWVINADSKTGKIAISTKSFAFDNEKAPSIIYSIAKATGSSESWAREIQGQYVQAMVKGDIALCKAIKNNVIIDAFKSLGLPNENEFAREIKSHIEAMDSGPSSAANYGSNTLGKDISGYYDTEGRYQVAGVASHQFTDELSIPNLTKVKDTLARAGYYSKYMTETSEVNGIQKAIVKTFHPAADLLRAGNSHVFRPLIDGIFKPVALATAGFALRVSAGEMFQAVARYGVMDTAKAYSGIAMAKLGVRPIEEYEKEHIAAAAGVALGGAEGITADAVKSGYPTFTGKLAQALPESAKKVLSKITPQDQLKYAIQNLTTYDGHIVNDTVGAGAGGSILTDSHNAIHAHYQNESAKVASTESDTIASKIKKNIKTKFDNTTEGFKSLNETQVINKEAKGFVGYQAESPHYLPSLVASLNKEAKDAAGQNIANDLRELSTNVKKLTLVSPTEEANIKVWNKLLENEPDLTSREAIMDSFNKVYDTNYTTIPEIKDHLQTINDHYNDPAVAASIKETKAIRDELINREYQRIIDTKAGNYDPYQRELLLGRRWKNQDPRDFAADRVDAKLGLLTGKDGTIFNDLIDKVAEGKSIAIEDVKKISRNSLPVNIPGRQIETWLTGGKGIIGLLSKGIDAGFNKILDPIINTISREPLYLLHYGIHMKPLEALVEDGTLDLSQAQRIAAYKAANSMIPQIHAPFVKSEFGAAVGSIMPFYFAQEQAIKRAYRAAMDTKAPVFGPLFGAYARKVQMAEQAMNNPNFITTDSSGNKYVQIPAVGYFGTLLQTIAKDLHLPIVGNLPIIAEGNLSSLKTVLPELNYPGLSPVATIPLNKIAHLFPAVADPIDKVLGPSKNQGLMNALIPSVAFNNAWAAMGSGDKDTALVNATFSAMMTAYYHGQVPDANASPKDFADWVRNIQNNARSILVLKAGLGLLSPLSPKVEQGDLGLHDAFVKLMQPKNKGGEGLNYIDASAEFFKRYGDRASAYTTGHTAQVNTGASFEPTNEALDWVKNNQSPDGLLGINSKVSLGAAFLIPQSGNPSWSLSSSAYQQLLADNLIRMKTPQELLNQFYIGQGWNDISAAKDAYDKAKVDDVYDSYSLGLAKTTYDEQVANLKTINPIWYASYSSGAVSKANANAAARQLQTIYSKPEMVPNTEQAKLVGEVVQLYTQYQSTMNQYKNEGISSGYLTTQAKTDYMNALTNLKTTQPKLATVINTVFSKLG